MTPQIKQRIEELRRGEVPEGYKKTKAGVVPIEWEEKRIGDVLTQRKTLMCVSKDAPLLSFTIEEGVIDPADKKSNKRDFLIKDITTKKFALTEVGDIIYNPANLKFGAIHRNNLRRGVVSPIYGVFYSTQDSIFMGYLLHNQHFIDYAKTYTEGTVEKLKTLSADTFLKLKITLPSLSEQKKIAEILSAQDKLIALKEKLIEEKKRQKKYLMQQLLTGKKRLPGFSGEWESFSFSETFTFLTTNTLSRNCMTTEHSRMNNIHYGDILTKYAEVLDCEKVQLPYIKNDMIPQTTEFLQNGDIVIADTAEDLAVGKVIELLNVHEMKILSGLHTMFCRPVKNKFSPGWLGYYMNSDAYHMQLIPLICGVKVSSISKKSILNTIILTPTIEEQKAIVNILSNADRELDLLNHDLDQEKQKKKALMQLLLSGIVRVNV